MDDPTGPYRYVAPDHIDLINEAMMAAGITRVQLANETEIDLSQLGRYLNRKQEPHDARLHEIAAGLQALGVSSITAADLIQAKRDAKRPQSQPRRFWMDDAWARLFVRLSRVPPQRQAFYLALITFLVYQIESLFDREPAPPESPPHVSDADFDIDR